jgi:uncharacterized protein YkwD
VCGGKLVRMALALALALPSASASARSVDPCAAAPHAQPPASDELAAACAINAERAARGMRPLRWRAELAAAARRYSEEMVTGRFFAHVSPAGGRLRTRVAAHGYLCGATRWELGEVLAWGTGWNGTPAGATAAWLGSPAHRDILLRPGYRDIGVGVGAGTPIHGSAYVDGLTYTAELGTRRGTGGVACDKRPDAGR